MEENKTIVDKLIETLEGLDYPVFRQGSMSQGQQYPNAFFTYWNGSTDDGSHYDNRAIKIIWEFDVNFYATSPNLVEEQLLAAKAALTEKGFIVSGVGYDVASDEPTHTGRGFEAVFIELET